MKRADLVAGQVYAVVRNGRYAGWQASTTSITPMLCLATEALVPARRAHPETPVGTTTVNGRVWSGAWVPHTEWHGIKSEACMAYLRDLPSGLPQEAAPGRISVSLVPLGQILGPWEEVFAEHQARERQRDEEARAHWSAQAALKARGDRARERADTLGLPALSIHGGSVSMSLTTFEAILERLAEKEN